MFEQGPAQATVFCYGNRPFWFRTSRFPGRTQMTLHSVLLGERVALPAFFTLSMKMWLRVFDALPSTNPRIWSWWVADMPAARYQLFGRICTRSSANRPVRFSASARPGSSFRAAAPLCLLGRIARSGFSDPTESRKLERGLLGRDRRRSDHPTSAESARV